MYLKNYLKLTKTLFYLVFSLEKELRVSHSPPPPTIYKAKLYYKLTDLEILTVNNFASDIVGLISFKPS